MSILKSIWSAIKRTFTAKNLDAAQAFVAKYLPEFGDELAAFSATLAKERGSLLELADHAKDLFKAAKGIDLSTSLATALAQAAYSASKPIILQEAEKLLKLK